MIFLQFKAKSTIKTHKQSHIQVKPVFYTFLNELLYEIQEI